MNGVADYFDALDTHHFPGAGSGKQARVYDLIRAQEQAVLAPLLDWLRARNNVRVLGPVDASVRAPTVALDCGRPGEELSEALVAHKVACWGGDFYSARLVEKMGAGHGALRLSFVHYTSPAEVEQAMKALDAVL